MRSALTLSLFLALASAAIAEPAHGPRGDQPAAPVRPQPASPALPNAPDASPLRHCDEDGYRRASTSPARITRLGDLPVADMHLLVRRRVNGCSVQTIVVRDVEANITLRRR